MKKIIFTLLVSIFTTTHSRETATETGTENHTTKPTTERDTKLDTTQSTKRVTLDTSEFDNSEFEFVTQLPTTPKTGYQQQLENIGARILSMMLALQTYAYCQYTKAKQLFIKQFIRSKKL